MHGLKDYCTITTGSEVPAIALQCNVIPVECPAQYLTRRLIHHVIIVGADHQ